MAYDQFRGRLIAPQTCADELEVSEFTVHRWIRNGSIKAVKPSSRCTRVDGDSLADFLSSRTVNPGCKEDQPAQLKTYTAKRGKNSAIELAGQA